MIVHGYFREGKDIFYTHNDLQSEVLSAVDNRRRAEILFSTWELPERIMKEKPWVKADHCKFISLIMFVVTDKLR
jgi:hypothetical protein